MTNIFVRQALEQGALAYQAGRLPEAEQAFKNVLANAPDHAEALYLLAVVFIRQGRMEEGEKFAARAIAKAPGQPAPHFHRGVALAGMRRLPEAVSSFDRAIALKPDYAEAFSNRGVALGMLGRGQEAVASFDRAIALRPDHVDAFVNRGVALMGLGRAPDAIKNFDSALALRPGLLDVVFLRGKVRLSLKQASPALADFDRVLATQAGHAEAQLGRAHALLISDRPAEALASAERATTLAPQAAETWFTRANVFLALKRQDEAIGDYDRALALKPDFADALVNRGNARFALHRFALALADYDAALKLQPNHADALLNRANTLVQLDRIPDAIADYDRAIALMPGQANILGQRGSALLLLGRAEEALASLRQARALDPDLPQLQGAILRASMQLCDWRDFADDQGRLLALVDAGRIPQAPFALLFVTDDPARQRRCAEQFAATNFPAVLPPLWQGQKYEHNKIRLAYLSDTFREHVTTVLAGGLFAGHDKARFETFAFSLSADDGSTARQQLEGAFDRFFDVSGDGDREIAAQIQALEIDILVDLDGFIEGSRPGIAARRPAPAQVSYLGYPGTTGAPYMDYLLADGVLIGPEDEGYYAEKTVRLPNSYQPNSNRAAVGAKPSRAEAGLPETGFVFCCFNNNHKITPDVFDIWMRLLSQTPDSVLWLLAMNETAKANLRREAETRGVAAERLVFAEVLRDQGAHFARQQLADLFLDTLPYNAHTTGSDALWAGLPLLTCRGQTFAARVAASLLLAAGLPELMTQSLEDYEAMALRLVREPALLKTLRDRLAKNRDSCALFDTDRMRRDLEAAYVRMWEIAEQGEPAQNLNIRN